VVREFIEKPAPIVARKVVAGGGLWKQLSWSSNVKTLLRYMRGVQGSCTKASGACATRGTNKFSP